MRSAKLPMQHSVGTLDVGFPPKVRRGLDFEAHVYRILHEVRHLGTIFGEFHFLKCQMNREVGFGKLMTLKYEATPTLPNRSTQYFTF
jgi:hypothetical protein